MHDDFTDMEPIRTDADRLGGASHHTVRTLKNSPSKLRDKLPTEVRSIFYFLWPTILGVAIGLSFIYIPLTYQGHKAGFAWTYTSDHAISTIILHWQAILAGEGSYTKEWLFPLLGATFFVCMRLLRTK